MQTRPLPKVLATLAILTCPGVGLTQATKSGHEGETYTPIPAPLGGAIEELGTQSSWEQNTRYEGPRPDKSRRGVFPIGNGRVFTYVGLGERANTMMAIAGPSYAATEQRLPRGNFGELTLDLGEQELPHQRVRRVTGSNFVVTEDRSEAGLALRTLTFAPPGSTTITRVIVVTNGTPHPIQSLRLRARPSAKAVVRGNALVVGYTSGAMKTAAHFQLENGKPDQGTLTADIRELAAGASYQSVLTVTTGDAGKINPTPGTTPLAIATAKETLRWWTRTLTRAPRLRTNHRRIMDLFKDWQVMMMTMRDEQSGVVSPMVTRRGAFIRESSGPILTFLRFNMWEEARGILNYFYRAIRHTGEVREHYPLDLAAADLQNVRPIDSIEVPSSDLASWVIIQHFWYFRATRDAAFAKARQPFLLHLLRKQRRGRDSLMHFSGHENYMSTLFAMDFNALPRRPLFPAHAPEKGRRAYSLASSVLFLMAIQSYGEMLDGIDRMENPEKWQVDDTMSIDKPSQKWLTRSFDVMKEIEKRFYVQNVRFPVRSELEESLKFGEDWTGFFAPAISPVTGQPHKEPFANINLFPLWIGFTFPTGERSRHNLRNTLGRLAHPTTGSGEQLRRKNTLVGATATVGHFTGDVPGMLLTALIERDGKDRIQALQDVLTIAEPACEWGRFYTPDGRPAAAPGHPQWPDRLSPNECGINLDAVIYALNGVRHVNIPNFDNKSIKVKLRLPPGANFLNIDNLKKDGRAFNVHVDEFFAPLTEEERKQNDAQKDKRFKRDPNIDHRRFRFRMRLLSDNPPSGRYQVDADVSGTMFVRYLYRGVVNGEPGDIDDREFWREDDEEFFLDGAKTVLPEGKPLDREKGAKLLVLTNRPQCVEVLGKDGVTYVDTGLPILGRELVRQILIDGKTTHEQILLDVDYDASDRSTFRRRAFWQHRNWKATLDRYVAAGGKIIRPAFVERYEVKSDGQWQAVTAKTGRLQREPPGPTKVRFHLHCAKNRDDVVLRLGTGCGYTIHCNGEAIGEEHGSRIAIRDQDSLLLTLKKGTNPIEVSLRADGDQVMFIQVTGTDGLPLPELLRSK